MRPGQAFDPPAVRKSRLAESTEILRRLLDGERVAFAGEHYEVKGARTLRSSQDHIPLLVGVNGRRALAHAAHHADIIGLTMLGRTLADGQHHEVRWRADRLDAAVSHIREQAGDRWEQLELNVLVQTVVVTNDRRAVAEEQAQRSRGALSVEDALTTPFLALGNHDEIAEHLRACRERWGISYFSVRDQFNFSPVIQRLRND
jgi:alkanesulfonate monooxygenase SsuD/methylene tetrahydromethanopterin reductase-like flavin-dependent oxidoreductase (luciferase family)